MCDFELPQFSAQALGNHDFGHIVPPAVPFACWCYIYCQNWPRIWLQKWGFLLPGSWFGGEPLLLLPSHFLWPPIPFLVGSSGNAIWLMPLLWGFLHSAWQISGWEIPASWNESWIKSWELELPSFNVMPPQRHKNIDQDSGVFCPPLVLLFSPAPHNQKLR